MNSIGTINTSHVVEYDQNCENYENLDNKYIIKVKSSSLDDVINLFKEPNFERFIREAFNCFIVCVEFDSNEEEEENEEKLISRCLNSAFSDNQRLIIVQLYSSLWIRQCFETSFKKGERTQFEHFFQSIKFEGDILNSTIESSIAFKYLNPEVDHLIGNMLKLFEFNNQYLNKIFEVAIRFKIAIDHVEDVLQICKEKHKHANDLKLHEIIIIILMKGLSSYDNKIWSNIKEQLKADGLSLDLEKITDEMEKYNGKSLLTKLRSRSAVALSLLILKSEDEQITNIFTKIMELNHESVNLLLEVVDDTLDITFDFKSDSIERSFPVATKNDRGIFDQDRMAIVVGAKNSFDPSSQEYKLREYEVLGILIHEICHYVCYKVFDNNCKPYRKDDVNIKEYEEIINEYKQWTNHHQIVGRVFSDYGEIMWHAELIVRVVQMIVTYKNLDAEHLDRLEENYQKLFLYFNDKIIPQIKNYLNPVNQLKRQIKNISSFRLDQFELKPLMQPLNYDKKKFIHFVVTNSPKLAMANFFLNFHDDFVIFTSFKDLMDEFKGNVILSLWGKYSKINIVIYCDEIKIDRELFKRCLDKLNSCFRTNQVFLIFESHSQNFETLRKMLTKRVENLGMMNFRFSDLTDGSKDIVLQNNVILQGSKTALNKIITKDSEAAQFLPINHFLESSEPIAVGKLPEKNADYDDKIFIQRKLTNKTVDQVVEFSTEKMDEILTLLSTQQYIIISDEVGKGKSTLMTYLAYQFLHSTLKQSEGKFFVLKINLHQHANELQRFTDDTDLDRFIFDNFLRNSSFEELEWKIFKDYFRKGKLILMLDGFDEIAPNCEEQTFKIISRIVSSKSSNIIVATRSLYAQQLNILNAYVLSLQPLSIQDQINFLINYLKSQSNIEKSFSESEITELCNKSINKMFGYIKEEYDPKSGAYVNLMMSYPLHLKMFADVIHSKIIEHAGNFNDVLKSIKCLNEFHLYENFFLSKVKIALKDKGKLVEEEIFNLENKGFKKLELLSCATKLALNTFHPALKKEPLSITDKEKKFLQRYGIVTMQNNEIYFVHRSYAEYLIAHSFLDNLIHGKLMESYFVLDHFLIDILTLEDYQIIKSFIDTALSDDNVYQEISIEDHKILGKFLIKKFEEMEGNDKNFLHCVIEHGKKKNSNVIINSCFVFVSHLLINSLIYCDKEEDIATVKNILQLSWEDKDELNNSMNIFELTCDLGINCLVSIIWKLAKKVFGNEAKKYFFGKYFEDPEHNLNPLTKFFNKIWTSRV